MKADGFLNLNKPQGVTSFSLVARVRRWSQVRRVGHGGTLDPLAQGVLPICLGQATRLAEFLAQARKVYLAQGKLGLATDTYDAEGKVTFQGDPSSLSREQVEAALGQFRGDILQRPPPFSAAKLHGRPLYSWARAGQLIEAPQRRVQVFRLDMADFSPPHLTLEVECGKGTYIRSLIHDLGQLLGCGAHLEGLLRTRVGPFFLEAAASPSQVELAFGEGWWPQLLHPPDVVLQGTGFVVVAEEAELRLRQGQPLTLPHSGQDWLRAYSGQGHLLALLRFSPAKGLWLPKKVFPAPS